MFFGIVAKDAKTILESQVTEGATASLFGNYRANAHMPHNSLTGSPHSKHKTRQSSWIHKDSGFLSHVQTDRHHANQV